ncbi:MAG: head decoration protein D [Bacteriophage sp.]|nr:MAG: head decoration protein D [Bacteriophage sp.]
MKGDTMLNKSGITKETLGAPTQILANVEHQFSVGCVVAQAVGTAVGSKKIAKAGTPIVIDYGSLSTAATTGTVGSTANAVLLHDVDVTAGNANGTALIFGFVNINRLESDVQAKVTAGANKVANVSFLKL